MTAPVLSLDRVGVVLGGRPIVRDVSFDVDPGQVVAIVGANGSGKSTLIKALVGLNPVSHGTVELFGTPLPRFRDHERVGYVPQRSDFASGVPATVREVVTSGRIARRRPVRAALADRSGHGHRGDGRGRDGRPGRALGGDPVGWPAAAGAGRPHAGRGARAVAPRRAERRGRRRQPGADRRDAGRAGPRRRERGRRTPRARAVRAAHRPRGGAARRAGDLRRAAGPARRRRRPRAPPRPRQPGWLPPLQAPLEGGR